MRPGEVADAMQAAAQARAEEAVSEPDKRSAYALGRLVGDVECRLWRVQEVLDLNGCECAKCECAEAECECPSCLACQVARVLGLEVRR